MLRRKPVAEQGGLPRRNTLQKILDDDLPPAANEETNSGIDKSVLALPEAKRLRDKQQLRFVAKQSCLVCGREPCDPHHLRFAQPRGLAQKVSDEFTNSPCRSAARIIANCTVPPRKGIGGRETGSSHLNPRAACGR
jgi:hypothetical protein